MEAGAQKKPPEIILRNGKPAAVILDLDIYLKLLERVKDVQGLREVESILHSFQDIDDEPLSQEDWEAIHRGEEDFNAGRIVKWEVFKREQNL
jgi:hypothetical protein